MWQQEFIWFFAIFHQEFRKNNPIAFEVLMVLAVRGIDLSRDTLLPQ